MSTVRSTSLARIRSSSISGVASFSGGFVVSFAHGYRSSRFQTWTCESIIRYLRDCAFARTGVTSAPIAWRRVNMPRGSRIDACFVFFIVQTVPVPIGSFLVNKIVSACAAENQARGHFVRADEGVTQPAVLDVHLEQRPYLVHFPSQRLLLGDLQIGLIFEYQGRTLLRKGDFTQSQHPYLFP